MSNNELVDYETFANEESTHQAQAAADSLNNQQQNSTSTTNASHTFPPPPPQVVFSLEEVLEEGQETITIINARGVPYTVSVRSLLERPSPPLPPRRRRGLEEENSRLLRERNLYQRQAAEMRQQVLTLTRERNDALQSRRGWKQEAERQKKVGDDFQGQLVDCQRDLAEVTKRRDFCEKHMNIWHETNTMNVKAIEEVRHENAKTIKTLQDEKEKLAAENTKLKQDLQSFINVQAVIFKEARELQAKLTTLLK